jgi:hypothetical protein
MPLPSTLLLPALVGAIAACGTAPATPDAGPPGARVFDMSRVHDIDLVLTAGTSAAGRADLRFDGQAIGTVGLNTADGEPPPGRPEKVALHVDLAAVTPSLRLDGLDALRLENDTALLHTVVTHELARRAGLAAPRTSHAAVRLDGQTLGFYVVVEASTDEYFARALGPGHQGGRLYHGPWDFDDDPAAAPQTLGDADRSALAALATTVLAAPDASFAADVAPLLDLDGYITYFAVESVLVSDASYTSSTNHYALYHDPQDGRFVFVPEGMDVLYMSDPVSFPTIPLTGLLGQRVVAIPALYAQYEAEAVRVAGLIEQAPSLEQLIVDRFELLQAASGDDPALFADVARTAQSLILLREGLVAAAGFAQ